MPLEEVLEQAVYGIHAHTMDFEAVLCQRPEKNQPMDDVTFVVGQLAGPGTYQCQACGREAKEYALSFEVEPCPCGGTTFKRID